MSAIRSIHITLTGFILGACLSACEINNSFSGDKALSQGDTPVGQTLLVLNRNGCLGCHSNWASYETDAEFIAPDPTYGSMIVPGSADTSNFYIAVTGGNTDVSSMPPSGAALSDGDKAIIKTWIDGMTP